MLLATTQLTGAAGYIKNTGIHTSTVYKDISIERKFQRHLTDPYHKHGVRINVSTYVNPKKI